MTKTPYRTYRSYCGLLPSLTEALLCRNPSLHSLWKAAIKPVNNRALLFGWRIFNYLFFKKPKPSSKSVYCILQQWEIELKTCECCFKNKYCIIILRQRDHNILIIKKYIYIYICKYKLCVVFQLWYGLISSAVHHKHPNKCGYLTCGVLNRIENILHFIFLFVAKTQILHCLRN